MNITIIGASAGIGLEATKRALDRKHKVTTLSRSEIGLPKSPNLKPIQGNALHKPDLIRSIQHADAVLVTLGTSKNMKSTTLFSDFTKLLVAVQDASNTQIPFIFVTGFGAGDSRNYVSWFVNIFIKYFLKDVYADKSKMEELISNSGMNWVIVRPGRLLDEPMTENYKVETKLYKGIKIGGINRADVADYLVKQAENPTELRKYPALLY
ncbi:MAG: NAD(P)H-binding protein [Saprospiraceae bacterium]|nr:NAD(P)H-binding protein [Saprospiraceae bacterium]